MGPKRPEEGGPVIWLFRGLLRGVLLARPKVTTQGAGVLLAAHVFACFFIFSGHDESSPEPADLAKQAGLAKSVNGVAPEVGSGSNRDDEAQEEPQDTRYIDSEADVAAAWEDVRGVEWWDRRIGVLSPRKLRK